MADVITKGVRATDGRKVQVAAADDAVKSDLSALLSNDLGAANGIATLDGSSLVVQEPANTSVPAVASTIAKRDGSGDLTVPPTPGSSTAAASKGYVDSLTTLGRSWKELILVPEQLVAGGTGGINQAFLIALDVDLASGDTFIITDGVVGGGLGETFTAVAAAPAAFQFIAGSGITTTLTNLVATINADSTLWNAVLTTGLDSYFSGTNDPQVVIYRQTPSTSNVDRCYGVIASAQSDLQVVNFGASPQDYATTDTLQAALPATDPTTQYAGFGRLFATLFAGETHRAADNSASYTWDGDDQVWQKTSAGDVLDGAGLAFTGNTLNIGDVNRGIQVNTDDLELDASEVAETSGGLKAGASSWQLAVEPADFAGTGLEDDGSDNLRLAAQGNGIAGGAGSTLSVDPDSTTGGNIQPVNVVANGVGLDVSAIAGTSLEADGSANLRIAATAAGDGLTGGGASALATDVDVPRWRQYTVAESAFTAAAASEDIELFSLPAGGIIQAVKIKHSTAFSGGTLSAFTVSVGITGTLDKYASAFDVFQAVADTTMQLSNSFGTEDHGSATSIRINAAATGDTVNNATAGSVDVWVLWSVAV